MPAQPPSGLHPWHDIPTGRRLPHEVTAVIEIPTDERNKYELDKTLRSSLAHFGLSRTNTGSCVAPEQVAEAFYSRKVAF